MSDSPEREQAEARLREAAKEARSRFVPGTPEKYPLSAVSVRITDLEDILAAVSRLEAQRDEWQAKAEGVQWGDLSASITERERADAAVERERELTRALSEWRELGRISGGGYGFVDGDLKTRTDALLAGGVSAAGQPPEQDLGGNTAVAQVRECIRKDIEWYETFGDEHSSLVQTLRDADAALTAATALQRSHQEVVPAAPEVLPEETRP